MSERHPAGATALALAALAVALASGAVTLYAVLEVRYILAAAGAGSTALWAWVGLTDAARIYRDRSNPDD